MTAQSGPCKCPWGRGQAGLLWLAAASKAPASPCPSDPQTASDQLSPVALSLGGAALHPCPRPSLSLAKTRQTDATSVEDGAPGRRAVRHGLVPSGFENHQEQPAGPGAGDAELGLGTDFRRDLVKELPCAFQKSRVNL